MFKTKLLNSNSIRKYVIRHYTKFNRENITNNSAVVNLIESYKIESNADWDNLKKELLNQFPEGVTDTNVNSILINGYTTIKNYDLAFNFVKHMEKNNIKLNLSMLGKIFRLHYSALNDKACSEEKALDIIQLYNNVKKKYPLLDIYTNEAAIMALSVTSEWKICLDIIKEIKKVAEPSQASYSYAVIAAFKNRCEEIGWNLLEEMIGIGRIPTNNCFEAYLNGIDPTDKNALNKIEVLLNFMGDNDIICGEELIDDFKRIFIELNKEPKFARISPKGLCSHCKGIFERTLLADKEFNILKQAFFDKVIIGKDIFRKSTPDELNRFRNFIATNKCYDVVIDGLNVAYSAGVNKPVSATSFYLASVVQHFVRQNKSVLVLGRMHMKNWPAKNINYIMKNSDTFLLHNISQDDPFLLYCALNSNLNTIIVTRDLMRSHLYLLKNIDHKRLFSRWLSQSQHQLIKVLNDGRVLLKHPPPYLRTAQKLDGVWHIPFSDDLEEQDNWLCVK